MFDTLLTFKIVLLGIIEGLTEFVPVSSTGHLILVDEVLGFKHEFGEHAATCFEVVIQLGAILAVVYLYRQRFIELFIPDPKKGSSGFRGKRGIMLLAITTTPALIAGAFLHGIIKQYFFNVWTVSAALFVGAVGIIIVEKFMPAPKSNDLDSLTWRQALWVGLFQCFSLWSGISRSAATIVGGLLGKVGRKTAAEYSFLAAVPVMFAASGYDLYKSWEYLSFDHLPYFVAGFVISFISAMFAVKGFIRLLQHWTLLPFAYYRLGISILAVIVFWLML